LIDGLFCRSDQCKFDADWHSGDSGNADKPTASVECYSNEHLRQCGYWRRGLRNGLWYT